MAEKKRRLDAALKELERFLEEKEGAGAGAEKELDVTRFHEMRAEELKQRPGDARGKRRVHAEFEEPEAFGAFEPPEEVGGEGFDFKVPLPGGGLKEAIRRETGLAEWDNPFPYEEMLEEEKRPSLLEALGNAIPKMSWDAHRGRVVTAFASVYAVFGFSLVYLLFFNTGLVVAEEAGANGTALVVLNGSRHIIEDVVVGYAEGAAFNEVATAQKLLPGEKMGLALEGFPQRQQLEVIARARHHQTVTAKVNLEGVRSESDLSTQFLVPKVAFVGKEFLVKAEVCNRGKAREDLILEERHAAGAFKENGKTESFELAAGACQEMRRVLTPLEPGTVEILYIVGTRDSSDEQRIQVDVRG